MNRERSQETALKLKKFRRRRWEGRGGCRRFKSIRSCFIEAKGGE
jgi:hypothetical protein